MPAPQRTIGHFLGIPLVVQGWTTLPIIPLVFWGFMAWIAGKQRPTRTLGQRLAVGAVTMPVVLGSEWLHNFAHAAASHWVGKPMDALLIMAGTPLCIYNDVNDRTVTPRQHIARALGGPLFSTLLLLIARLARRLTKPGTTARETAEAAVTMNTLIATAAYYPLPELDGGPLVKWTLISRGKTVAQADENLRRVHSLLGPVTLAGAAWALAKKRWLYGGMAAVLGTVSLLVAANKLREEDYTRIRSSL